MNTPSIIKNNNASGISLGDFSSHNEVKWNDFIANNVGGDSQATDNGASNTFTSNYWYEWSDTSKPYEISGTAENSDSSPLASTNNPDSPTDITAPPPASSPSWLIIPSLLLLIVLTVVRKNKHS